MGRFRATTPHKSGCSGIATRLMVGMMLLALVSGEAQSIRGAAGDTQLEPAGEATVQGTVQGSGKGSLAGANVYLRTKDSETLTARTDSNGAYRFSAVRAGTYTLRAEMVGYVAATSNSFVLGQKESKAIDLTLEPAKASEPPNSATGKPEFFDEPHFTVAGVTDTTNLGGHGSDVTVRNSEALARATASLKHDPPGKADDEAGRHHLLAEVDEKRGDSLDAVREYQRAAGLNPSESNLFDWGSELLLHRAAEPALEVFTKGNRMFPHSVRMLAGLGAAWYAHGSYDQAVLYLCEASDLNPGDPTPYLFLGKMDAVEKTESEAVVERLARFVRLQPENALANYYYAVALWKRRESPEDVADLERVRTLLLKAVQLDPKLGVAYLELGVLYSEQRDFSKAISAYQQATAATPQLEEAHYRLMQAYRQAGETSKAQAELLVYTQVSKQKEEELERQRHELQQFVYELRDQTPASPPQ
ncbi:MAG: carboxypeptidase regulatory-like domain-containing protein [Candidatus Sulfotelmatobacter sp.]